MSAKAKQPITMLMEDRICLTIRRTEITSPFSKQLMTVRNDKTTICHACIRTGYRICWSSHKGKTCYSLMGEVMAVSAIGWMVRLSLLILSVLEKNVSAAREGEALFVRSGKATPIPSKWHTRIIVFSQWIMLWDWMKLSNKFLHRYLFSVCCMIHDILEQEILLPKRVCNPNLLDACIEYFSSDIRNN